jgi:hypothetical protein
MPPLPRPNPATSLATGGRLTQALEVADALLRLKPRTTASRPPSPTPRCARNGSGDHLLQVALQVRLVQERMIAIRRTQSLQVVARGEHERHVTSGSAG